MDVAQEWQDAQHRVIDLVRDVGEDQAEAKVPACPDWSVRQLLAHMVGLDADVLAGDEPDDHNSAWTQRQVDERADHPIAQIVDEWERLAPDLVRYLQATSPRPLGDVIIHEQDLRGALHRSGARHTAGLAAIRDAMAERFTARARDAGVAVRLVGDDGWTLNTSEDEPQLMLRAPTFDLARAVMSRRSARQLGSWVEEGDLGPHLGLFEVLGPLPEVDLTD